MSTAIPRLGFALLSYLLAPRGCVAIAKIDMPVILKRSEESRPIMVTNGQILRLRLRMTLRHLTGERYTCDLTKFLF
jgi:hypothetical protein